MNFRSFSALAARLTLLVASLSLISVLALGVSRWLSPFDEGHYEGGMWAPSLLMARGINPYSLHLVQNPPYTMSPYGPVSYLLIGAGLRIFGLQFQSGRTFVLLAFFVCSACIAWLTHSVTRRKRFALLSVAFFWSQLPVLYWVGVQRPDFIALAFGLSAVCGAIRVLDDENATRKRRLIGMTLCAVLTVCAVLSRLTTFLSFFSILWLCHKSEAQRELRFFLFGTIGLLTGTVWALNSTSDGGFWWQQWTMAGTAPKSFDNVGWQLAQMLDKSPATTCTLFLIAAAWLKERHKPAFADKCSTVNAPSSRVENILPALRWSAIVALLVAFATSTRAGADLNYWIEASAYLSVAAAVSWPRLANETQIFWRPGFALCLVVVALSATWPLRSLWQDEQLRWSSVPYLRRVVAAIEQHSAPQEPSFGLYVDLIYAAHRTPFFNDPIQYDKRSPLHALLERSLTQRRFATILAMEPTPGYHRLKVRSELRGQYVRLYIRNKKVERNRPQSSTRSLQKPPT